MPDTRAAVNRFIADSSSVFLVEDAVLEALIDKPEWHS